MRRGKILNPLPDWPKMAGAQGTRGQNGAPWQIGHLGSPTPPKGHPLVSLNGCTWFQHISLPTATTGLGGWPLFFRVHSTGQLCSSAVDVLPQQVQDPRPVQRLRRGVKGPEDCDTALADGCSIVGGQRWLPLCKRKVSHDICWRKRWKLGGWHAQRGLYRRQDIQWRGGRAWVDPLSVPPPRRCTNPRLTLKLWGEVWCRADPWIQGVLCQPMQKWGPKKAEILPSPCTKM